MKTGRNNAGVGVLERPDTMSEERIKEAFDIIVAGIGEEFDSCIPPYQRTLFTYLFAKLEGKRPPEAIAKQLRDKKFLEFLKNDTKKFNQLVGDLPAPVLQLIIVRLLTDLQPKEKEFAEETTRDEARDELINLVGELSYTEQTGIYKELSEQVRNKEAVAVCS